jgi:CheY-like chemotaxis protein
VLAATLEFVTSCGRQIDSAPDAEPVVLNILVIDDEDDCRGLAVFKTGHFELVCLDISMPALDGLETMRTLRELHPTIPILATSRSPATPDKGTKPDFPIPATKPGAVRGLSQPFSDSQPGSDVVPRR